MVQKNSQGLMVSKRGFSFVESKYVFCLFIALIFSLVDGTMTIFLVEKGAFEANPLMRYVLSVSQELFFLLKYFLTAAGLFFLLLNGKKRIFKGLFSLEEIAGGFVVFYEALVVYEIAIYHFVR